MRPESIHTGVSTMIKSAFGVTLAASLAASAYAQPTLQAVASHATMSHSLSTQPADVVAFWREAGPALWFAKDDAFDRRFRERFLAAHEAAARGELAEWAATADGALALVILLDQFPRNSFRGSARMYATDALARSIANVAIAAGQDREIARDMRVFMYLPLGHSEDLADQERCVELARALSPEELAHAEHHRDIVKRFGRFPHRNAILGRPTRPEEQTYLDEGGYAG
jgi:uncharacterized protein (DUF924 family)